MSLENRIGCNALFIMEEKAINPEESERRHREKDLNVMFANVTELPPLTVKIGGRPVKVFRYYKCLDLKVVYPKGKPTRKSLT